MKKKIITDTNIWYDITEEELKSIYPNYDLVIPILVLSELYTSSKIHSSEKALSFWKRAVSTIINNRQHFLFIELDPFEHYLRNVLPTTSPRLSANWYLKEMNFMLTLPYSTLKDTHPERADISGLTDYVNSQSIEYGRYIEANKFKFKSLDTRPMMESYILKLANDNLKAQNQNLPEIKELPKPKYDFLISVFDDFLRDISKTRRKMQQNDWIDMFNLTYVGKDDLYWTKEISILRSIENTQMNHNKFVFGSS